MNALLQQRIQNLMGGEMPMQGAVSDQEAQMMQTMQPMGATSDQDLDMLREQMQMLESAMMDAEDPMERQQLQHLQDGLENAMNAPYAEDAAMLANLGRGEDSALAHLRAGEVVLPPEAFDDPRFEKAVEGRFQDLGIEPEQAVVGVGIASLNPNTGLEEFGFFKKITKSVKKVVKKVGKPLAQVGQFIPGPHQPFAAAAAKAFTVYDVAKGRASPLALASVFGPTATGGSLGKNLQGIRNFGSSGTLLGGLKSGIGALPGGLYDAATGVLNDPMGSLFGNVATGKKGLAGLLGSATFTGQPAPQSPAEMTPDQQQVYSQAYDQAIAQGATPEQASAFGMQAIGGGVFGSVLGGTTNLGQLLTGGNQQGGFNLFGGNQQGFGGGSGSGGGLGLGNLGILGLAGLLGKKAYDATKDEKGVPLTPLTQMGPTGRYNIEAEIARRMGEQAPDPVEFGLLPAGTFPELSGGAPAKRAYGGPVMAFAEGGNVDMEEFQRMDGQINGEGTETSDDIPAMLSDGEFVMTGQAVRGAGSYEMSNDGGIIQLREGKGESRDDGTKLMYDLMGIFENSARSPA
tara:strand:- start:9189 stop:10907 length:1719 start_codon:yes stop_codon:yes gene_type:complete